MGTADLSLNPNIRSAETVEFQKALRSKIVGRTRRANARRALPGVHRRTEFPGSPGWQPVVPRPTGSGKTRIVEAAAEILFGSRAPSSKSIARNSSTPRNRQVDRLAPGYLGHRETHPLITQEALAAHHSDKLKLSFLLFDEIEKASDALWQLLLGMLDKATLTLGDNRRVDLSQTVIFMTSNLGAGEIAELMDGGYGLHQI